MPRVEIRSIFDSRNRKTLVKFLALVVGSLITTYIVLRWSYTTRGRLPSSSIPGGNRPSKPLEVLRNPYKDINLDAKPSYQTTLVIAKVAKEDTAWVDELDVPGLTKAVYVADDLNAPLHPPVNKGHEAMVYLTYIIDNYDGTLPDVVIFMHFHSATWHNNDLLDSSSSQIVRSLNTEKIVREGYMNLRCHWEPGCPSWIHPQTKHFDDHKMEEQEISKAFTQLWPDDPVPEVLSQPCCGQFAVSGERIRRRPKRRYEELREWIKKTDLDDTMSGRVFEYTWQYLFTAKPVHCRNMHLCYCDGYSICFETEHAYIQYLDILDTYRAFRDDLGAWKEQDEKFKKGESGAEPEPGRGGFLQRSIDDLLVELERRKKAAVDAGKDRRTKYGILERAWDELARHPPGHLAEKYGHFGVDSEI